MSIYNMSVYIYTYMHKFTLIYIGPYTYRFMHGLPIYTPKCIHSYSIHTCIYMPIYICLGHVYICPSTHIKVCMQACM